MQNELSTLLKLFHQERLIDDLDPENVQSVLDQIKGWDRQDLFDMHQSIRECSSLVSLSKCFESQFQKIRKVPKMGVIILAGGSGSRLGSLAPKGCFPLLNISLFERHIRKIPSNAPAAIMTSELNHQQTVSFFQKNDFFGRPDIRFFSQGSLPLFDEAQRWFWQKKGRIAAGADGNGSIFRSFKSSGLLNAFEESQVEVIQIVPVDNPLADPFDLVFSSFHLEQKADLSIKCIRLDDPLEPTGRLMEKDGKLVVAEFAELSTEQKKECLWANTGLIAISMPFMKELAIQKFPFHWAWRQTPCFEQAQASFKYAWKAEKFIVDALLFAKNARAICYPREQCFAPLKEKSSIVLIEDLLGRIE